MFIQCLKKQSLKIKFKSFSIFNKLKTFIEPKEDYNNLTEQVDINKIKVEYFKEDELKTENKPDIISIK